MHPLALRIRLGDQRTRLAQPEAELPKQVLTLAHSQGNPEAALNPSAERLAVPGIAAQPGFLRAAAQRGIDLLELPLTQAAGPPRSLAFQQTGKPVLFKAVHPILHRSGRITEKPGDFQTTHSLSYEQQPMQTMVVAGLGVATDLILQAEDDGRGIRDGEGFHASIRTQILLMRNYLLRRV